MQSRIRTLDPTAPYEKHFTSVEDSLHNDVSFVMGVAFQRWKPSVNTETSDCDDLFLLPISPPVMAHTEASHCGPLALCDDPGSAASVTEVLETSRLSVSGRTLSNWPTTREALRSYLGTTFFSEHVSRYSAQSSQGTDLLGSWPLPTGSYAVWLYYHRFTKDAFYKVLDDYVTQKVEHERRKLRSIAGRRGRRANSLAAGGTGRSRNRSSLN